MPFALLAVQEVMAMKANEYTKGKNFSTSTGFPIGRTIIDLSKAEFKDSEYVDATTGKSRPIIQMELGEKTFSVPMSVMKKIQQATENGYSMVEVNREGTTKNDTTYVTYILDKDGKIVEAKK